MPHSGPNIELKLDYHIEGVHEVEGHDLALTIAEHLTVLSLSVTYESVAHVAGTGYWQKLLWVAQFPPLRELTIGGTHAEIRLFDEFLDWEGLFENIPTASSMDPVFLYFFALLSSFSFH